MPHQALTLRYRGRLALSTTHASNAPHTTLAPPPSLSSSFAPSDHHKHKIVADGMTTTSTKLSGQHHNGISHIPIVSTTSAPIGESHYSSIDTHNTGLLLALLAI